MLAYDVKFLYSNCWKYSTDVIYLQYKIVIRDSVSKYSILQIEKSNLDITQNSRINDYFRMFEVNLNFMRNKVIFWLQISRRFWCIVAKEFQAESEQTGQTPLRSLQHPQHIHFVFFLHSTQYPDPIGILIGSVWYWSSSFIGDARNSYYNKIW